MKFCHFLSVPEGSDFRFINTVSSQYVVSMMSVSSQYPPVCCKLDVSIMSVGGANGQNMYTFLRKNSKMWYRFRQKHVKTCPSVYLITKKSIQGSSKVSKVSKYRNFR